jgi:tRNA A37 threonylcarbamoyladenosine modification protein TsaB
LAREEKLDTVKNWFESVEWINDSHSTPHASSVAELGWKKWRAGDTLDPFALLPLYFRGSAAEEKASKAV